VVAEISNRCIKGTKIKFKIFVMQVNSTQLGISILICTYNPAEQIFKRTLNSVASLNVPAALPIECIIIDNNSPVPIGELAYVREFLDRCPWARVITEKQQGLTFARLAGIEASSNSIGIFIDDDNEVVPTYLETVTDLFSKYTNVGAWGPGNVNVEFMDSVSDWFRNNFQTVFQERHVRFNEYGCVPETWMSFYPVGTGLCVRREILEKYRAEVKNSNLSSSDRKGKALSSGGDIQLVWEGIKIGWAAGVSPALSVNHLIPANRSTLAYVKRLNFGTAASFLPCLYSSFPDLKSTRVLPLSTTSDIMLVLIKTAIKYSLKFKLNLLATDLASYLGSVCAEYQVCQKHNPVLDSIIDRLKLR
jgi:glycosyltransferase involved in cell wall biosynthesis